MIITRIAKQQRRDRYNVFVDGTFAAALAVDVLAEAGWREGDTVDPGEVSRFAEKDEYGKALHAAYRFLGRRPHSVGELRTKLSRKGYPVGLMEQVLGHLAELGYLDDEAFARQWVMERGSDRGNALLRSELRKKSISDEVIDRVLLKHRETHDPAIEAEVVARKRWTRLADDPKREAKLSAFLARRGYDYDVIRQVLERVSGKS